MEKKAKKTTPETPIAGGFFASSTLIIDLFEQAQQEQEEKEKDIYLDKLKKTLNGKELILENYQSTSICY